MRLVLYPIYIYLLSTLLYVRSGQAKPRYDGDGDDDDGIPHVGTILQVVYLLILLVALYIQVGKYLRYLQYPRPP